MKKIALHIFFGAILGLFNYQYLYLCLASSDHLDWSWKTLVAVGFTIALVFFLNGVLKRVNNRFFKKSGLYNVFLFGALINCTILLISWLIIWFAFDSFVFSYFTKVLFVLTISGVIHSIYYHAFFSYSRYQTEKMMQMKIGEKQVELQLQALKMQLNPHFLYNNLNTLSSLISSEFSVVNKYTRSLSALFLNTVGINQEPIVELKKELNIIHSFYNLLQIKYGGAILLTEDIDLDCLEKKIPPLTLQLLFENAVKHNKHSLQEPLEVVVSARNDKLVVKNTFKPKKVTSPSFGIGLTNILERYALLGGKKIKVKEGDYFEVQVPLL